ncbi:MAG: hypothetical protein IPJ87_00080 [Flavobacteriales bacterium]|nr:hypothetical protein [Flavobacteriales bacterium]
MRFFLFALWLSATGWASAQNITGYEYWFNMDGLNGQRVFVPAGNAPVIDLNNLGIPLGTLPLGHHRIHYRLKDGNGRWSSVISKPFTRIQGGPYEITGGEYWFDTSTNRTPFGLGPGQTVSANISADVSGLQQGPHKAHYRLRDNHGFWSSVISKPFSVLPDGPYELVLLRYWSDQEPEEANISDLTTVPITPNMQYLDIIDDVLFCNWSTTGQTDVFFQLQDNHGQWSSVITRGIDVDAVSAPPGAAAVSGPTLVLDNSAQTYATTTVPGASYYVWTLPTGWTGTSTGNAINVTTGDPLEDGWVVVAAVMDVVSVSRTACSSRSAARASVAVRPPTSGSFPIPATASLPSPCPMRTAPSGCRC